MIRVIKRARFRLGITFVLASVIATSVAVARCVGADARCDSEFRAALNAQRRNATLEDEFFDLLWRCDSPVAEERARACAELARRVLDFEPISCARAFLTNGEISPVARDAFLQAEKECYSAAVEREILELDYTELTVAPPTADARRRCVAKLKIPARVRVIYFAPDFSRYAFHDPDASSLWTPCSPFASQEIQPEYDADVAEVETILEEQATADGESYASAPGFEALLGCELRTIAIPVVDATSRPKVKEYRLDELTYSVARVTAQDDERVTVELSFRYDTAYDAFDSHRVWLAPDDFALAYDRAVDEPAIITPRSLRELARNASGARIRLTFDVDSSFRADLEAVSDLTLLWRAPRRLVYLRR